MVAARGGGGGGGGRFVRMVRRWLLAPLYRRGPIAREGDRSAPCGPGENGLGGVTAPTEKFNLREQSVQHTDPLGGRTLRFCSGIPGGICH